MIVDSRTTVYTAPAVPLSAREVEHHIHYASNALALGHEDSCGLVRTARNWPALWGRPSCSCSKGVGLSAVQL